MPKFVFSLFSWIVWSTTVVDRAYRLFDRMRSKIVLASAPDGFYDFYNNFIYPDIWEFRPGTDKFRSQLMPFEERALSQYFPSPPARLLVGGAGGGREAFALARRGYQVVAFDPVPQLSEAMTRYGNGLAVESFIGRYEELPIVSSLSRVAVDLRSRASFDAAIMGWTSFSHLRSDELCIESLRQIGALTDGPILISYFGSSPGSFSARIGYHRGYCGAEVQVLAERAGLETVHFDDTDTWPHAILRVRGTTN